MRGDRLTVRRFRDFAQIRIDDYHVIDDDFDACSFGDDDFVVPLACGMEGTVLCGGEQAFFPPMISDVCMRG